MDEKPNLRFEKARFLLSAPRVDLLPEQDRPEIVLIGRSNVGKSSLLNYLCGQNNLARTSKTPGRTQQINVFEASLEKKPVHILDMPGLGYAKLPIAKQKEISALLESYFQSKRATCILHLFDCRREPLVACKFNLAIITKIDQIPISKRANIRKQLAQLLKMPAEKCFLISSQKQLGREALLQYILLEYFSALFY